MIHVCFALYDKTGSYSRFTGTAMLSLLENTNSKVTIHLLHDNTLTNDNRDKFIQIAERYGQLLRFYNVEELCVDKLVEIEKFFPKLDIDRYSFATFYRLFIPHLLHQGIEKAIYLDTDIIVNLDIADFWKVELAEHPLGAIPEIYQFKDKNAAIENRKHYAPILNPEDYFNAGVIFMNLKILRDEEATIKAGMKFISERTSAYPYQDQDILNYCFSTTYLKLPLKFNCFVFRAKLNEEWTIQKNVYHYIGGRVHFNMDTNDPYNRLFMSYFIKTPWIDADTAVALSGISISARKSYAVSVIIPMYNAEEFIDECLDSLLMQTFQDFEVIVVDDCSTDNSVEVVKNYAPKFNGRLRIEKTETNSGGGNVPRNIGLMLARGDYVQFLDADGMLLSTALETLYKAASFFDAEVVYTASLYDLTAPNDIYLRKDGTSKKMRDVYTDFTIDDQSKNLSRLLLEGEQGNFHGSWTKFIQRDFLLKNKIFFPNLSLSGDFIWVINLYCHARHFLRISTPLYFYRSYTENSVLRTIREPQEQCRHWFSAFVNFVECLHELEKENEVLAENPLYCLMTLKEHLTWTLKQTEYARTKLDGKEIYKILYSEFVKSSDDSLAGLLPFLFAFIDNEEKYENHYVDSNPIINKFKPYFTAKVYVLIDKKMDNDTIQILYVSDNKATLTKPEWWQRNGTCHMINSYIGQLKIVAKAIVEGTVQIRLAGPYVVNPKDTSKRIPYWIDYTKLKINEQTIFDTLTPAWHNKAYVYNMDVKADDKIKIQVEWLPHRSDTIETKAETPPPKIATPTQKYETARLDVKFNSQTAHSDFQILSLSDKNANMTKPAWLQKNGVGYQIQSDVGNLNFVAKASVEGRVLLDLRGLDVRDPQDKSKRIPYWIDYTNLTVDEKVIFDTITPAWHDKTYRYEFDVKADEEIKIQVEWLPHRSDTIETPPLKVTAPEQKISAPSSNAVKPKIEPVLPKVVEPELKYETARVDVKFVSRTGYGDFKILSLSDKNADVSKPGWLQKGGTGYQIQSDAGKLEFIAKITADGQLNCNLKGIVVINPNDPTRRIPYRVYYTNLTINEQTIFNTIVPAWNDRPYRHSMDVKASDEVKIQVEWQPKSSNA